MQIGVRLELLIGSSIAASHREEEEKKEVVYGFLIPYSVVQIEK